jgi:hypothetical protein
VERWKYAPQADEIGLSFLVSTEADIREHLGLVHSASAHIRDEIIHKRTEDHPIGPSVSVSLSRKVLTHVTGKINVLIRSDARPVTFGMST